jgi:Ni,Fe-hydrogenase I large subunit
MDSNSTPGPVEQALNTSNVGGGTSFDARQMQIVNILRLVHPFDCCIACAVHVVNTEGKDVMKFAIGPDGRPANIEISE